MLSHRAAAVAVILSFFVGLAGSLALRPPTSASVTGPQTGTEVPLRIHWRVPVSNPTNLPVIGENPIWLAETLLQVSGGAVRFDIYDPGEIVPSFGISDAVRDGKVPAGMTWLGYDQGKTPASALLAATPFGMEPWEYSAWWYEAGGKELGSNLYKTHNIHPVYCGMTGPETAGWFKQEIKNTKDVEGLKIRFAGIGGKVMEEVGASVTMLPAGEIFQALEKGAIDASEFALPIVDEALGFNRVAKLNYYPGWHQPFTATHLIINLNVWQQLAKRDKKMIETACAARVAKMLAQSEATQGPVIEDFPAIGVTAKRLPLELLKHLDTVTQKVLNDEASKDPMFARILSSQRKFESDYYHWKRLAYLPRDFRE